MLHSHDIMTSANETTFALNPVNNLIADATMLPIPDLYDPAAFEAWRWNCLEEQKIARDIVTNCLLNLNTMIARVRAAMLLTTVAPQRSRELAESVIRESQDVEYFMARVTLAQLDCVEACYDPSPKISSLLLNDKSRDSSLCTSMKTFDGIF